MCSIFADFIRALVLDSDGTHVLMVMDEEGQWDLPYFVFDKSHPDNYKECAAELQKQLQMDAHFPCFTARAELLGRYGLDKPRKSPTETKYGYGRLACLEMHIGHIDTSDKWEWKDAGFVMSLNAPEEYDEGFQLSMTRTAQILNRDPSLMKQLSQPRHQPGWYRNASSWLKRVVEEQGADVTGVVSQFRVTYWSRILCVNSTRGRFFLKSPTVSTEMTITNAVQELMPERTLDVVGFSEPLKSFISKEFELVYGREEDKHTLYLAMVEEIASMQLASIQHKEALLAAGCPLLGPDELILELDDWIADDELWGEDLLSPVCLRGLRRNLRDLLPQVKKHLRRLHDYKIPLTITHGDFSLRNVGFKKDENGEERMIMFDWQNTAISHPFFEFHEFEERLTEGEDDAYLMHWTIFEPLDRCRELYEIAQPLGWLLRLKANVSCFRIANPEYYSESALEFGELADHFIWCVEKISS